jgi:hypothetical protein
MRDGGGPPPYPGAAASKWEILDLAHAYSQAGTALFRKACKEEPLSYAPARLCCIHAIELYLNAFLRHEGATPEAIRKRMHDLADPGFVEKLRLRRKTARHLATMTERREYLVARYGPEQIGSHTELNRLSATLVEVMTKAGRHIAATAASGASGARPDGNA